MAPSGSHRRYLASFPGGASRSRELVHNEAFNVGASSENYRIREIAEMIEKVVPGAQASFAEGGGPDKRSYQVDCSKIDACCRTSSRSGTVPWVSRALRGICPPGPDVRRVHRLALPAHKRVQDLQASGRIDDDLRWLVAVGAER